jgi:hypothetical protein
MERKFHENNDREKGQMPGISLSLPVAENEGQKTFLSQILGGCHTCPE